jgi:hypothetical protein
VGDRVICRSLMAARLSSSDQKSSGGPVSERTGGVEARIVRTHVSGVFAKTASKTRVQSILWARNDDLIDTDLPSRGSDDR